MIKINLSVAQKQMDMTNVGGFDFTKIKIKAVILVCALIYLPDFILLPMWETEFNDKTAEFQVLQRKSGALKRKVALSSTLEKQIRELKMQEENLGKKLTAVKQAIGLKRNPSNLLLYISKNMPADLWIKELTIEGENLSVRGESLTYGSVGNFVNNLKSSVFIREANIKSTTSTVRESDKRRIESFELSFAVSRFD
jgi:Tfp pilus assembly protein PilN